MFLLCNIDAFLCKGKTLIQGMKQNGFCSCSFCHDEGSNSFVNSSVICYPWHDGFNDIKDLLRNHKDHITQANMASLWKMEVKIIIKDRISHFFHCFSFIF